MKKKINKAMPGLDLGNGWVKAKRNWVQAKVLMAKSHNATCLLYLIALRAWRGPGINEHGCHVGEGFVGDFKEWGFTRKGYRVAQKQLADFGFASFRATNRGTIAKLLSPEIFDINVDAGVTDRAEKGLQGAIKGPSEGLQGATNKKLRSEEAEKERNQEINNTNNSADAGGGVVPPLAGAVAPGEEEAPPAPVGEMPETGEEETPDHKAIMLSRELPLYVKHVAHLNQRPVFTQSTLDAAREWFQRNTNHEMGDTIAVCAL